jgi:Tfp pilus assembly protein PilF/lysophospholipase L1-like esterase
LDNKEQHKTRVFRLILILLPLLFFALLEGVLRFIDYGGDLSLFRETVVNGKAYYTINPDVTKRYFRTIQVRAMVSNDMFEKEKRPNTYRIFCLGESSTLGYPYMFNGSFPSMLKVRLESMWPDKNIEVVNLGITAVNSYTAADFTKELVAYKPDAILIYCGHNEFYGALGVGSTEGLGKTRWVVKTYLAMEGWRTFRLLRDGLNAIREKLGSDRTHGRDATVMEGMVRNREIVYGSDDYVAARDNFRGNLEDIAQLGAAHSIKVVFGTLVSNLSGLAPFVSTFSSGTETSKRDEWAQLYKEAEVSYEKSEFATAEAHLLTALKIDSLPAKGHFLLAKIYQKSGRFEPAAKEYGLARDFDALRFRAPSEFNTIIRDVASRYNLPVAESEKLIAGKSEQGIIGDEFAVEHVHLNVNGYFLLSEAFYQAMADNGFIAQRERWNWKLERGENEQRAEVCVTPLDSVMASIRLFVLKNSWPFRDGGISVQQFNARTDLERLAKSYLMKEVSWEQAHVKAAERYESEGKLNEAAREYRALARVTPHNTSPHLRLGQLLLNIGDDNGAKLAFEKSLRIGGSYYAHHGIGLVLFRKKEFENAVGQFRKALQFTNGIAPAAIVETQQLFAVALASAGDLSEAETVAQSIVSAHPEQTQAKDLLDRIRREKSKSGGKLP